MKPKSKRARVLQPEKCGVWLDARVLRRTPQQSLLPQYSSGRFYPFTKKKTVESLLLDFTPTRAPQPCTKQTSMYSFFTSAGRKNDLNIIKSMSNNPHAVKNGELYCEESENSNERYVVPSLSQEMHSESLSNEENSEFSGNINRETLDVEADEECCESYHLQDRFFKAEKGESENSSLLDGPDSPQTSIFSQQEHFAVPLLSPESCSHLSNTEKKKHQSCSFTDTLDFSVYHEEDSNEEQENLNNSVADSQLFTQDSQGNKVICHRPKLKNVPTTFPLHDRTNVKDRDLPQSETKALLDGEVLMKMSSLQEEASLKSLFTQDSEGNVVIKHKCQ